MNLNDVRLFIRVIEHNSFTAAADKLGIQKSTISRRIAQLEDELGVRLLQRTTRKLSLTSEGQDLFQRCQPLLDEMEAVEDRVVSKQAVPKGRLRITMPPEMGIFIMNDVIAGFMKMYPLIQIDIELSPRLVDLVEDGIDLALRVGELTDSSLIGRKIADVNIKLYAGVNYLEKHGEPKTPDDLINHQCLGGALSDPGWIFENWNDGKPVPANFKVRANSISFCREMLRKDLGIARLPIQFCMDDIESGLIKEVLSDYQAPDVSINALYPSRRHLNPKVRLFIDFMIESLEEHQHPWLNKP
ncbi:LysR family transcriptional regulator [Neptuniibacter marinus]|mgnify:CR=1 FL=1|uniref:LysR family transcriptional regulator n=1 Tax=Neptuniibacter marinus TaxID=1806670 RepID=UPI000833BC88|nr:LysR family transcriptional regulator [Neptuniibacter marinus]